MSKRSNGFERRDRDFYPTPVAAVVPLLPHLRAARVRRFAEPCCGDGALVCHLESFGLVCTYSGDIASGQDALDVPRFDATVITNPPFDRKVLLPLLVHFIVTAPCCWLLLPLDWSATKQARPFMPRCSDIVMVGRLRWIADSPFTSLDNFAWLRFAADHHAGPVLHAGTNPTPVRAMSCTSCGRSFVPTRTDARHCSQACRQRAYRERLAVT